MPFSTTPSFAAGSQVLVLKLRHIFFGELTRYVSSKGLACEFKTMGFEDCYRCDQPKKILIFNRESKVYYEGTNNNNRELNRASILVGMTARSSTASFSWGGEKWTKERKVILQGLPCSYFETQKGNDKWQIWISKEPPMPNSLYQTVSGWLRLPNLGGLPVRACRTSGFGKPNTVLDLTSAKKAPPPANFLQCPPGLKRVSNVTEVCVSKDSLMKDVLETLK